MGDEHERPALAGVGQQLLQVADDRGAVARLRSRIGEAQARAVVGARAEPLGGQLLLHRAPVGGKSERARFHQHGGSAIGRRALADHVQPQAAADVV